jgi:hypothetical protein
MIKLLSLLVRLGLRQFLAQAWIKPGDLFQPISKYKNNGISS